MEKNKKGANRKDSRIYFDQYNQPEVHINLSGYTTSGMVVDWSSLGLSIVIHDMSFKIKKGNIISRLFLGSPCDDLYIDDLKVAYVHTLKKEKKKKIGIGLAFPEQGQILTSLFRLYSEGIWIDDKKTIRKDRLPSSVGESSFSDNAIASRAQWIETLSGASLTHLQVHSLIPEKLVGNIENLVGALQIPLGVAGPLLINGTYTHGYIPVPIATTEGALVASLTRGARICALSGGITTRVTRDTMLRAPVFFCENLISAANLLQWILKHENDIKFKAESISSVAELTKIEPVLFGNTLHLKFYYRTGDASGQNMTTACTYIACEWIVKQIKEDKSINFDRYMIEGNLSSDKKVTYQSVIDGRGVSVTAECLIPERILRRYTRVTVDEFIELYRSSQVSSTLSGMIGTNVNFANAIAGIFTAAGQDIGSVPESSPGVFNVGKKGNSLRVTVSLPSLVIGTIGGGTALPTQKECLDMMGCYGKGKKLRLAEIIAAACLSLDLSTATAIGTNEFVKAHETLGRNRPSNLLSRSEIDSEFISSLLTSKNIEVLHVFEEKLKYHEGIASSFLDSKRRGTKGVFNYTVGYHKNGNEQDFRAVLKLLSDNTELLDLSVNIAMLSGVQRLPGLFSEYQTVFGFENGNRRELSIYTKPGKQLKRFLPQCYGTKCIPEREVFAVLMEDLSDADMMATTNTPELWTDEKIKFVLKEMVELHSIYFNKYSAIPKQHYIERFNSDQLYQSRELLAELSDYNFNRFPDIISKQIQTLIKIFLHNIYEYTDVMNSFPMTLVHNDFNTRNLCIRSGKKPSLVLFDWELSTFRNPQRDLIEFLLFTLSEADFMHNFGRYTDFYLVELQKKAGKIFSDENFNQTLIVNALEMAITRFNLYLIAHNITKFSFLERVYRNLSKILVTNYQKLSNLKN